MEKKVIKFKGDDIFKGVIPFDSDYVHEFKPENVEGVSIKMRPMSKGEKRDYRRLGIQIAFCLEKGEPHTDALEDQWDLVAETIAGWIGFKKHDKSEVKFSKEAFDCLPDWLKIDIAEESKKISGLNKKDEQVLE